MGPFHGVGKTKKSTLPESGNALRRGKARMAWLVLTAALSLAVIFPAEKSMAAQNPQIGDDIEPPYVECCRNNSDFVRLRSGPSAVYYPQVGILTNGEKAKAVGQSKTGAWIQIVYTAAPGGVAWATITYVTFFEGPEPLPVIQDPPIPQNQATIDPTLAAQFSSDQPTRLASFTPATPPATVSIPSGDTTAPKGGIPPIILILGLLSIGTFGSILTATVIRR
jgi:hypothetical protein